jgi:EmrB/QacA subfamily drug resistance transporter
MADDHRPHPTRSLLILGIAGMAFALGQTMLIPAIPELIRVLHTDPSGVAWTVTGYLLSAAVFTPIVGRLGDMFGKRRLLVVSLIAFCAGSALSALTSSLEIVVAGRVLQGVGGGIFPLCFGIIRDEFPRERVAQSIGLMSAIAGIGGGFGLIIGGLIVDQASYHWIFWLGAIMAAVAAVSTHLFIPESPVRTPGRIDVRGAIVLAVGLVLPLLAISQAHDWGWTSLRTLGMILAGIVILVGWVELEKRTDQPLADIGSLSSRPVLMTNLATVLVGFGMFGSFILIPQLAQAPESTGYGFGLNATGAGLLMLPGSIAMLFLGPVSGALGGRYGSRLPLTIGGLLAGVGLALMSIAHGSEGTVLAFNLVLSAGIGFAFAAMPNLIVEAVPSERTGEATGFNALLRSVGASLGSQVTAAVLAGSAVAGTVLPTDGGYTRAFGVGAVVAVLAGIMALFIPRRDRSGGGGEPHVAAADVGAAAPLGEPALSRS